MFDPREGWMPLGSVVRMRGAERLVMVVGYMPVVGESGRAWDYAGYPYPEGKQAPTEVFFDRTDIGELFQFGFCDAEGMAFLAHLATLEEDYQHERARRNDGSR